MGMKNKREVENNSIKDEQRKINEVAMKYGSIVFASVFVILTLIDLMRNATTTQATLVFCSFLGTEAIIQYKYTKNKKKMVLGSLYLFLFLAMLIIYVMDVIGI